MPVLILAGITAFVFVKLPTIKDVPAAKAGAQHLQIRVEGHQYYWQFTYPGGQVAVKRMVVPVGRVVELTVVSPDVIHSWWVPVARRQDRRDPGPRRTTRGSRPRSPATTRCAAPSCAASSTRT